MKIWLNQARLGERIRALLRVGWGLYTRRFAARRRASDLNSYCGQAEAGL
ncbi:MAG: hypothetical protein ACE5GE_13340 [Phycisphaerae bacterium]